ncbi:DUF669 domain-containing protein [Lysinibacillus fusiformis]|uniref:DUF669 domain-containing protein n=1 Tax=Lysinibacillus fusiformis TaxID=28031 RepID=UPI000880F8ED|nr:DUF669 domain-containing protein [Lysinibacillus fusiformis]SCX38374.1 Protein of unknown function [Lysinibacillus fusiformis]SDB05371.1 Protein of unknown function [Lysinibacillus fusiformis]SFH75129.1 Protein of unknown function [Lysinibacillus fusiformis]SFT29743.1 Protein of unknown function [Lysinibacillus fusiformis]
MFKINHEEAKGGFELIAKGDYEVTVHNYEMKKATTGNNQVVVDYEIRSDVNQPHQGQKILFDNFTVTDKAMWRFQAISKAAQFPDGMDFNSYKEWADTLVGKHLVVTVGHRVANNGKTYPEVTGFKESAAGAPQGSGPITVSEDDVPF